MKALSLDNPTLSPAASITGGSAPSNPSEASAGPFLKWVGGKRSILPVLLARTPSQYSSYHEPFLGGGALFFALAPKQAVLSDLNGRLIQTYVSVRDKAPALLRRLERLEREHDTEQFSRARSRLSTSHDPLTQAALFIYLNKTCYNGLYRVNRRGQFNVPLGSYKSPRIVDEPALLAASKALQGIQINSNDFASCKPTRGSFWYLDPPYHQTYDSYANPRFGDDEHERLATFCRQIDQAGGYFMLSNSDTPFIRRLYKGFQVEQVRAARSVSCKGSQRGKATELLIRNYD